MTTIIRFSILATLVLCCASTFAQTVEPLGSFDIKSSLPPNYAADRIAVRAFAANNSGLYFLLDVNPQHPPIAKMLILHTDSAGARQKLILLPPTGLGLHGVEKRQFGEIHVDGSGNVYLSQWKLRPDTPENSFAVYNLNGNKTNVTALGPKESISTFCLNNDKVFYIDGTPVFRRTLASIRGLSTKQDSVAQWEAYGPLRIRSLTSSKLVVLEMIDCRLQIIDLSSGGRTPVSLATIPEVMKGIAAQHPDEYGRHTEQTKYVARSVVVNDIVTTTNGDIFLNVMGHHISQGAVIVRLNKDGNFLRSSRYKLPSFNDLKTEDYPDGQMNSEWIGVSDTHLFVQGDGKVAKFPL